MTDFKIPPRSLKRIKPLNELQNIFSSLVGNEFILSGVPRTDGSKIRKLICDALDNHQVAEAASSNEFQIIPPKGKGVPRILRELIDSYVVTSGDNYNLQIWNRIPNSNSVLVQYSSGEVIRCSDIRIVLVKVIDNKIQSIIITTPNVIEQKFGVFGKPTIKHQLMISDKKRADIVGSDNHILTENDSIKISYRLTDNYNGPYIPKGILAEPKEEYLSIKSLVQIVASKLIGVKLDAADTKTRGQRLERITFELLGYKDEDMEVLQGQYPDVPEQLLEVKLQDSPTVDLGMHTPEVAELLSDNSDITSQDIRYLIALANKSTGIIEGVILMPGAKLKDYFTFVSETNYKCQRSIPMNFFNEHLGSCVIMNEPQMLDKHNGLFLSQGELSDVGQK